MAVGRRRPSAEFEQAQAAAGRQMLTLASFNGGYNGYTSPELLSPQFWEQASNVYSGLFGTVRRARWAPVIPNFITGALTTSMYGYTSPTAGPDVLVDAGQQRLLWGFTSGLVNLVASGLNFYAPVANFVGPVMRVGMPGLVFEANGLVRSKFIPQSPLTGLWLWGIDGPDASPEIAVAAGQSLTISSISRTSNIVTLITTTPLTSAFIPGNFITVSGVTTTDFNSATGTAFQILTASGSTLTYAQTGNNETDTTGSVAAEITTTVGRSYQWAWENANTTQVSPPSPASQYINYNDQIGTITCVEPGTVSVSGVTVNGTNTAFSQAWVGRSIWVAGISSLANQYRQIVSVTNSNTLTVDTTFGAGTSGAQFTIFDRQSTNIRLYATGDGAAVYFRIGRNTFDHTQTTVAAAGLQFTDTANSAPPNAPFSNEISQIYNVPPPIGYYLSSYQGRVVLYGVPAAPQSFFYSNIESTTVGQPPESFAPLNQVTLPIGNGQIFGMANLPTGLIIWSNHQDMFKLTGLLSDNTVSSTSQLGATIQKLPYAIGCASPYATAVTPLGCVWLSSDREVWLFTDNYAPKNVGKPIQDVLNSINTSQLANARIAYYKKGDRSWLCLAVATGSATSNNVLLILDLDLLASNGQPSFFTFDMATNQPSWYIYNINCNAIATAYDASGTSLGYNHILAGDLNLVTDVDWQPGYYTSSAEQNVPNSGFTLHAFGNEAPHVIKLIDWIRCNTNQSPAVIQASGWSWFINIYDDDQYLLEINPQVVLMNPANNPNNSIRPLEFSQAKFNFGGVVGTNVAKGRRFQVGTVFPSTPGFYEMRSFQVVLNNTGAS